MAYKIGVGLNYYDDLHGLIYQLEAKPGYYDKVDKIYLIDGRYAGREDVPFYNPDETSYLVKKYPKIHYVQMYDRKQIDKRNRYWELAEEDGMDFMFVIDSDEYFHIENTDSLRTLVDRPEKCFPIEQKHQDICTMTRPRLFKAPFTFRHIQSTQPNTVSHGSLYEPDGTEIINGMYMYFKDHPKRHLNTEHQAGVPGFYFFHDKQFRSRERVIADRVYYDSVPDR